MATPRKLFVNLPVKDLKRSVDFFTKLGFEFNPQFTDENATCMIISEEAYVMLLVEPYFEGFLKKPLGDFANTTSALLAIGARSREEVDQIVKTALENGGAPANDPPDHGFMYQATFLDPDGHHWEVVWMDPSAMPPQ